MKRPSHYEWLIVVEGSTDVRFFKHYLCDNNKSSSTCYIDRAGGKSFVKNMPVLPVTDPDVINRIRKAMVR